MTQAAPHEPDFLFFRHFDGLPGLFLDVGANRGQSALSLRAVNGSFEIVSFEPNPEHRPALTALAARLGPGFRYHPFGLGSASERRRLVVPRAEGADLSPGASLEPSEYLKEHVMARLRRDAGGARLQLTETEVEVRRLDELGLAPDVIKADVEGWEAAVLRGAEETLRRHRPVLLVELNNHPPLRDLLAGWGYAPFRYEPDRDVLRPWHDEWDALNLFYLHGQAQERLRAALPAVFRG